MQTSVATLAGCQKTLVEAPRAGVSSPAGPCGPRCGAGMKKGCRAGWFRRGTRKVAVTYSPAFAVPSARRGLTSLFGMGRGGAPVLWPPECLCAHAPDRGRAYGVKRSGRKQEPDGTDTRGDTAAEGHGFFFSWGLRPGKVRAISTARLCTLPCLHLRPIDVIVSDGPALRRPNLEGGFVLRCFQHLSWPGAATRRCGWRHNRYTGAPSDTVLSY